LISFEHLPKVAKRGHFMGLLDVFRSKKTCTEQQKKNGRGRSLTPEQQMLKEKAKALRELRKRNPEKWLKLVMGELEGEESKTPQDGIMQLGQQIKALKEIGIWPKDSKNVGESGGIEKWLEALPAALMLMQQMQAQNRPPQQIIVAQPQATIEPTPNTGQPVQQRLLVEPEEQEQPKMTLAMFLISNLRDKNPQEAAAWLVSSQIEGMQQVLAALPKVPDVALPFAVSQIASMRPDLADFAAWLDKRPDWFRETVHELKKLPSGTADSEPQPKLSMGI
jgi:hypothetical protein